MTFVTRLSTMPSQHQRFWGYHGEAEAVTRSCRHAEPLAPCGEWWREYPTEGWSDGLRAYWWGHRGAAPIGLSGPARSPEVFFLFEKVVHPAVLHNPTCYGRTNFGAE